MTERYITHHVTDHCAIQGPESQVLVKSQWSPSKGAPKSEAIVDQPQHDLDTTGCPLPAAGNIKQREDSIKMEKGASKPFSGVRNEMRGLDATALCWGSADGKSLPTATGAVKQSLTTGDLVSREAAIEAMFGQTICGIIVEGKYHAIDVTEAEKAVLALPAHHLGDGNKMADRRPDLTWIIENTTQVRVRDMALEVFNDLDAHIRALPVVQNHTTPAAQAAHFVVDYMERETGLPFGDMIGMRDAERIKGLARSAFAAAPAVKVKPGLVAELVLIAEKRHVHNITNLTIANADRIAEAARILAALEGGEA